MMVNRQRRAPCMVTRQHEWDSEAVFSSRMDYLAGVLCFVFVDEIHQKEPETHIQTVKNKTEAHNIIIKLF